MINNRKLGDSRDKKLIVDIFGSVEYFEQTLEEHGNEFQLSWLVVDYDKDNNIHNFYKWGMK
tara:strand:- start:158 stop:343 length:186 start_codon:yes stop_codon:yes gene_type:complete